MYKLFTPSVDAQKFNNRVLLYIFVTNCFIGVSSSTSSSHHTTRAQRAWCSVIKFFVFQFIIRCRLESSSNMWCKRARPPPQCTCQTSSKTMTAKSVSDAGLVHKLFTVRLSAYSNFLITKLTKRVYAVYICMLSMSACVKITMTTTRKGIFFNAPAFDWFFRPLAWLNSLLLMVGPS